MVFKTYAGLLVLESMAAVPRGWAAFFANAVKK